MGLIFTVPGGCRFDQQYLINGVIADMNISPIHIENTRPGDKQNTDQGKITCSIMAHTVNSAKCTFQQH